MNEIGNKIKSERRKKSLKQKELAELAGISNTYLCDIEKGRSNPSIETLKTIAVALQTEVSKLI